MTETTVMLPHPTIEVRRPGVMARLRSAEPAFLLWLLLVATLIFLVVVPIGKLLVVSFERQDGGGFTFANYLAAYGRVRYLEALGNSLILGTASAMLSAIFAVPMAWAVSRTDMPGKGLTWAVVMGAFIMPPYLGAVGWILLAGPNSGLLNQAWRFLTGAGDPLVNVYSFPGHALVIALHSFPLIFLFVKSALVLISSEM